MQPVSTGLVDLDDSETETMPAKRPRAMDRAPTPSVFPLGWVAEALLDLQLMPGGTVATEQYLTNAMCATSRRDAELELYVALRAVSRDVSLATAGLLEMDHVDTTLQCLAEWMPPVLAHASQSLVAAAVFGAAVSTRLRADAEAMLSQLTESSSPPRCEQCAIFTLAMGRTAPKCECTPARFHGLTQGVIAFRLRAAEHAEESIQRLAALCFDVGLVRGAIRALRRFRAIASAVGEGLRERELNWEAAGATPYTRMQDAGAIGDYNTSHWRFICDLLLRLFGAGTSHRARSETAALRAGLISFTPEVWFRRDARPPARAVQHFPTNCRALTSLLERSARTAGMACMVDLSYAFIDEEQTRVVYNLAAGAMPFEDWRRQADLGARLRAARKLALALEELSAVGIRGPVSADCIMILGAGGEEERPVLLDRGAFSFDGRGAPEYRETAGKLIASLLTVDVPPLGRMGAVAEAAGTLALQMPASLGGIVAALDRAMQSDHCTACQGNIEPAPPGAPCPWAACDDGHYACGKCLGRYIQQTPRVTQTEYGWQVKCMCCPLPLLPARLVACLSARACQQWQRRIGDAEGVAPPISGSDAVALNESQNMRCPACSAVFLDFDGCLALTCEACHRIFCGACLVYVAPNHDDPWTRIRFAGAWLGVSGPRADCCISGEATRGAFDVASVAWAFVAVASFAAFLAAASADTVGFAFGIAWIISVLSGVCTNWAGAFEGVASAGPVLFPAGEPPCRPLLESTGRGCAVRDAEEAAGERVAPRSALAAARAHVFCPVTRGAVTRGGATTGYADEERAVAVGEEVAPEAEVDMMDSPSAALLYFEFQRAEMRTLTSQTFTLSRHMTIVVVWYLSPLGGSPMNCGISRLAVARGLVGLLYHNSKEPFNGSNIPSL